MARIDLPENYAIRNARQWVRDSLMSHGEECILLCAYHVTTDFDTQPRCPACYDDMYEQPDTQDCATCYGTTFLGGIKAAYRAWGIFTDAVDQEDMTKHGMWHPISRKLQTEHLPDIWEHDFVVRVTSWDKEWRVNGVEGIYVCDVVNNESLRTGNRTGQVTMDAIAQNASIEHIAPQMAIHHYPIVGRHFDRIDGKPR